jgi:hypothetical protein
MNTHKKEKTKSRKSDLQHGDDYQLDQQFGCWDGSLGAVESNHRVLIGSSHLLKEDQSNGWIYFTFRMDQDQSHIDLFDLQVHYYVQDSRHDLLL